MMIDSLRSSVMRISLYNGWDKRWVEFKFAKSEQRLSIALSKCAVQIPLNEFWWLTKNHLLFQITQKSPKKCWAHVPVITSVTFDLKWFSVSDK